MFRVLGNLATPGGPCRRLEAVRHGAPPAICGTEGIQGGSAWFTINYIDACGADFQSWHCQRMSSGPETSEVVALPPVDNSMVAD